ncbi:hypothetical protein Trydic_g1201 [Trypoxylus dichotomus]
MLAALKTPSNGEDPKEFLDKLNRKYFEKVISSDSPAIQMATTQKISGRTKHRTVTESLRKLIRGTSNKSGSLEASSKFP